jgi:hypothetical protein
MDTTVDTIAILRWIQATHMVFYYRHAEMSFGKGQKMAHIYMIFYKYIAHPVTQLHVIPVGMMYNAWSDPFPSSMCSQELCKVCRMTA